MAATARRSKESFNGFRDVGKRCFSLFGKALRFKLDLENHCWLLNVVILGCWLAIGTIDGPDRLNRLPWC